MDTSYTDSDEVQEVENSNLLVPDDESDEVKNLNILEPDFEINENESLDNFAPDAEIDKDESSQNLQLDEEEIEQQQNYYSANVAPKSDVQILYIIQEKDLQFLTQPEIENQIEYEVPLIDFAALFGNSFCKSINMPCEFWQRRMRYTWNNETQKCQQNFLCENEGFQSEQDCMQQAPNLCT